MTSHPCSGVAGGPERRDDGAAVYTWTRSCFGRAAVEERRGPFATPFVFHHRPLTDSWRASAAVGLTVTDLEAPVVAATRPPGLGEALGASPRAPDRWR